MKARKICLIVFLIIALNLLTGCGNSNSVTDLKSKVKAEINYLDGKIVSISNSINNINLQNYKIEIREIAAPESQSQGGQEENQSSRQK